MPHQLIASPYPEGHVVVRPSCEGAVRIGAARYAELRDAPPEALVPSWLTAPARTGWGADLAGLLIRDTVLVRPETGYGYARASYEVNLGCNYDCEHCYLGEKLFAGLDWPGRERLLQVMADAGVLWLQLTGGEPLIDPLFAETHAAAWDMGMMIQISSNGSRLDQPRTLDLLTSRRPYRLTLSLYGATEESYDAMTRRRGSFRRFMRGLAAAHDAELPIRINIVVSNRNAHEIPAMKAIADRYGIASFEYANISPTIHDGAEVLPSQSREMLRTRRPYTGCNAGITHFHADPHGRASICKVGRDPQIDLIAEGPAGLRKLAAAADALLTRHGGCSGCTLHKTCGTRMPLARLYQQAQAPLEVFCQHGRRSPAISCQSRQEELAASRQHPTKGQDP
jgi:MoaA/NifB/PqqE/SkfB family radical SAM enzyme